MHAVARLLDRSRSSKAPSSSVRTTTATFSIKASAFVTENLVVNRSHLYLPIYGERSRMPKLHVWFCVLMLSLLAANIGTISYITCFLSVVVSSWTRRRVRASLSSIVRTYVRSSVSEFLFSSFKFLFIYFLSFFAIEIDSMPYLVNVSGLWLKLLSLLLQLPMALTR